MPARAASKRRRNNACGLWLDSPGAVSRSHHRQSSHQNSLQCYNEAQGVQGQQASPCSVCKAHGAGHQGGPQFSLRPMCLAWHTCSCACRAQLSSARLARAACGRGIATQETAGPTAAAAAPGGRPCPRQARGACAVAIVTGLTARPAAAAAAAPGGRPGASAGPL